MPTHKQLAFNVLIETIAGGFVAYCLEMGIVATAITQDEVIAKIQKLIQRQLEFALKNNRLSDVFRAAPNEVFEKFRSAHAASAYLGSVTLRLKDDGDDNEGFVINQNNYALAC